MPRMAAGQGPEWHGTWTLDLAKSTYDPGPPPYKRARFTIEPGEDGAVRVVYDMVRVRGGVTHLEWTGKFDGNDYPVQGVEELVTYSYRRVDDRTYDVVTRLDGSITAVSRVTLSADANTITTVTEGRNAQGRPVTTTTVYERTSPAKRVGRADPAEGAVQQPERIEADQLQLHADAVAVHLAVEDQPIIGRPLVREP